MLQRKSLGHLIGAGVLVVALVAAPASADSDSTGSEGAWGAGAAITSLVYGPVKVIYALGGAIVSGMAWIWSGGDRDVMQPILDASLRGDYVLTPAHLRGDKPIEFVGRNPANRALREGEYGAQVGQGEPIQSEEVYSDSF